MTKSAINVGDRVLHCITWTPGMKPLEKRGEGVVTLITELEDDRRCRVLWTSGNFSWHEENELVNIKNVK